jgi:hypothetical protein
LFFIEDVLKRYEKNWLSDLDMSVLGDDLEAVEVGAHLAHVVDHRGNPEDGGMTPIVLKAVTHIGCGR